MSDWSSDVCSSDLVGEIRGLGLMAAVELVRDKATKAEFAPEERVGFRVHAATQERGMFTRLRGDVYCIAPPEIPPVPVLGRIVEILRDRRTGRRVGKEGVRRFRSWGQPVLS